MDTLPPEVLRMVCAYLSYEDAAALRFLNRDLALVAAEVLVARVRFHTSQKSLHRLRKLSEHPILSQSIKVLVYEAALLADVGCHHDYARHFELDHHGIEQPKEPAKTCSDRERRLYDRNKTKWDRNIYSKYRTYRSLFDSQRQLLVDDKLGKTLSECVPRFTKLTTIEIDPVRRCRHMTSERFIEEFGSDCASPLSGNFSRISEQFKNILLPKDMVLTSLRKIEVNSLSPSFFQTSRAHLLQNAFKRLTEIDISLKLADGDTLVSELAKDCFRRHLSNGVFRDAVSCARNLEFLSIGIESPVPCFVDTSLLFSPTTWPRLKSIYLNTVASTQIDLMAILKRQPRLTSLNLALVNLTEGNWPTVLTQMRQELSLVSFMPVGFLEDADELWQMDLLSVPLYLENYEELDLGTAISIYVTQDAFEEKQPGEQPHPLLDSFEDYEEANLVRDLYGHPSDVDISDSIDAMSDIDMLDADSDMDESEPSD